MVAVFLSIPQREPSRQANSQREVSIANLSRRAEDAQYSPDEFERQVAEKREQMRQYNLQLQEYNRMAKERIRYGADEVIENTSEGTLTLKGHAWWRLDDNIVSGQHGSKVSYCPRFGYASGFEDDWQSRKKPSDSLGQGEQE